MCAGEGSLVGALGAAVGIPVVQSHQCRREELQPGRSGLWAAEGLLLQPQHRPVGLDLLRLLVLPPPKPEMLLFFPVSLCDLSCLTTGPVLKTTLVLPFLVEQPFFRVALLCLWC